MAPDVITGGDLFLEKATGPAERENGRGDRIRTCDILLPKQARYRTAPLPDTGIIRPNWPTVVGPAGFEPAT
jgi:hypothetical protein